MDVPADDALGLIAGVVLLLELFYDAWRRERGRRHTEGELVWRSLSERSR